VGPWCGRSCAAPGRQAGDDATRLEQVKKSYGEKNWEEAARRAQGPAEQSAELDYYAGMALSRLERWREAKQAFSSGERKARSDARFVTERAGTEYKLAEYAAAKQDLRRALRLEPGDAYAAEFLGTIYLLEGNLEAALKYWNRVGKPKLAAVEAVPKAKTRREILERAVTFAPPAVLKRDELLRTDALLENLGVFARWRTDVTPAAEAQSGQGGQGGDQYKATIALSERSGWGATAVDGAIGLLRGLPYQTVFPTWYGVGGEAINFTGLARWDQEKRRAAGSVEFPVMRQPAKRVRFYVDARNENWNLSRTFFGGSSAISDLNMKRVAGGVEYHQVESGWWDWSAGAEGASRQFANVPAGLAARAVPFFTDSGSAAGWIGIHGWLVRNPERRFTLEGSGEARGGRSYAAGLGAFGAVKGDLQARWLPRARGDDFELRVRMRGGDTTGDVPLDMLYQLGVERDNDLWMRGHGGTTDGRKGRAPLGRRYVLWNSELNKTIYDGGFFRVQAGPFFDTGAVADASGVFGSQKWLFDTGIQARVRVLGAVSVVLSYGRDLRNGSGAFYATSMR